MSEGKLFVVLVQTSQKLLTHRIVLEQQNMVNQLLVALNVSQGKIMVFGKRERFLLHLLHQLGKRLLRSRLDADRHRVDEQSDHLFDVRQVARTSGDNRAEHDVFRVALALQHQPPNRAEQIVDRHLQLLGELVQAVRQRLLNRKHQFRLSVAVFAALLVYKAGRFIAAYILSPARFCLFGVLLSQPTDIRAVRVNRAKLDGQAAFSLLINLKKVVEDNRNAPTVQQNMMVTPEKGMRVSRSPDKSETDQYVFGQIKACLAIFLRKVFQTGSLLLFRKVGNIQHLNLCLSFPEHDLPGLLHFFQEKDRSENIVSFNQRVQALFQDSWIDEPFDRKAHLFKIGLASFVQKGMKQHSLLHRS